MTTGPRILAVRLGAMGDVIHTLPAVASLKDSFPGSPIDWIVESRWTPLLEANPYVDRVIPLERNTLQGLLRSWRSLRARRYPIAVDFQGLTKSALVAELARPERIYGFADSRESPARWFYSRRTLPTGIHMVDRNLDLACSAGASRRLREFPLPPGRPEGDLPSGDFVLASPLAGWGAKQWPLEYYAELGRLLRKEAGLTLVLNGPQPLSAPHAEQHVSGLAGLIYATRRAAAVVGVDSGPLHLAAALGKPGVAIYGPTDPAINGPYCSALRLLRSPAASTTYRRTSQPVESMRSIRPADVFAALQPMLSRRSSAV